LNQNVEDLAKTFAAAKWSDVTEIQNGLSTLSKSLAGLNGVDITGLDAAALARIEQQLARIQSDGSGSVLRDIEALLGSSSSSGGSVLSRLDGISSQLNSVGASASDATIQAQSARSKADDAASAASAARQAIEEGNLGQAMSAIQQVLSELQSARADLQKIPQDGGGSEIYDRMRTMASTIEAWGAQFGLKYPLTYQEPKGGTTAADDTAEAGGEAGAGAEIGVKELSASIQEMRISMEFLKKMIEDVAYEPVVEEALIAVE
ncbi:MAG: hypothetical protein O3C57_08430, partial [Verrucomicrobia bacterium]|nr:hypothetical protein [Verrucomicrobiota bacterium]